MSRASSSARRGSRPRRSFDSSPIPSALMPPPIRSAETCASPGRARSHLRPRLGLDVETELRDEAECPDEPQRILDEARRCDRADRPTSHVSLAVEGVEQRAVREATRHGVDREVSARHVLLEGDRRIADDGEIPVPRAGRALGARRGELDSRGRKSANDSVVRVETNSDELAVHFHVLHPPVRLEERSQLDLVDARNDEVLVALRKPEQLVSHGAPDDVRVDPERADVRADLGWACEIVTLGTACAQVVARWMRGLASIEHPYVCRMRHEIVGRRRALADRRRRHRRRADDGFRRNRPRRRARDRQDGPLAGRRRRRPAAPESIVLTAQPTAIESRLPYSALGDVVRDVPRLVPQRPDRAARQQPSVPPRFSRLEPRDSGRAPRQSVGLPTCFRRSSPAASSSSWRSTTSNGSTSRPASPFAYALRRLASTSARVLLARRPPVGASTDIEDALRRPRSRHPRRSAHSASRRFTTSWPSEPVRSLREDDARPDLHAPPAETRTTRSRWHGS